MASTPNIDILEAKWWDRRYHEQVEFAFFSTYLALEELCTGITSGNAFQLTWLFTEYFTCKPKGVLSVGYGDGTQEFST